MIAALFVMPRGPYSEVPGLDLWDEARDARQYAGPWPVVAHPPCERWGRYWYGSPLSKVRKIKGDDGGCFASALASVRAYGGILEHPAASAAWAHFGLAAPPRAGGWVKADSFGGWTCCVDQLHYGHRAQKATWLYAVGTDLPELVWGKSSGGIRLDEGFRTAEQRKAAKLRPGYKPPEQLSKRERKETPPPIPRSPLAYCGERQRARRRFGGATMKPFPTPGAYAPRPGGFRQIGETNDLATSLRYSRSRDLHSCGLLENIFLAGGEPDQGSRPDRPEGKYAFSSARGKKICRNPRLKYSQFTNNHKPL